MILAKTLDNIELNISRVAIYVHSDVHTKVRSDLMNDSFSSIWLEMGLPNQREILFCMVYRDWQYMDQAGNNSRSIHEQSAHWIQYLDQWERALQLGVSVQDCYSGVRILLTRVLLDL